MSYETCIDNLPRALTSGQYVSVEARCHQLRSHWRQAGVVVIGHKRHGMNCWFLLGVGLRRFIRLARLQVRQAPGRRRELVTELQAYPGFDRADCPVQYLDQLITDPEGVATSHWAQECRVYDAKLKALPEPRKGQPAVFEGGFYLLDRPSVRWQGGWVLSTDPGFDPRGKRIELSASVLARARVDAEMLS